MISIQCPCRHFFIFPILIISQRKRSYRVLGLINKSFECKDPDVIINLYTTLVCPIVEYNNILWGPYTLDYQKLEKIQRKATGIIPSISYVSMIDYNLSSLQQCRQRGDLIYLYQLLKSTDINNIFFTLSNSTITRHHTKNYSSIIASY